MTGPGVIPGVVLAEDGDVRVLVRPSDAKACRGEMTIGTLTRGDDTLFAEFMSGVRIALDPDAELCLRLAKTVSLWTHDGKAAVLMTHGIRLS